MLRYMKIVLIIIMAFSFFVFLNAQDKRSHQEKTKSEIRQAENKAWNEVCPVRGNKVNPKVQMVEYKEKLYGFCCGGCDTKFEKEPEKYSRNLSEDGKKFIGKKS